MMIASGVRIGWADLPGRVRDAVQALLGSPVVRASTQAGGFSPGTADRVVTEAGDRAFVKAVGRSLNSRSVEMARTELRLTAALPADARSQGDALIPWLSRTRPVDGDPATVGATAHRRGPGDAEH